MRGIADVEDRDEEDQPKGVANVRGRKLCCIRRVGARRLLHEGSQSLFCESSEVQSLSAGDDPEETGSTVNLSLSLI